MKITNTNQKAQFPELRGNLDSLHYPAWAEPKFDGEYNQLIKPWGEKPYLLNKYGKKREDFELTRWLFNESSHLRYVILGELIYYNGLTGELTELLKNKHSDALKFVPFDIETLNGISLKREPLITRLEIMRREFPISSIGKVVRSKAEALGHFKKACNQGYEGTVVKSLDSHLQYGPCHWVKLKKKDENVYQVWNIDPTKERIEVFVPFGPGSTGKAVGVKVCNKDKIHLKIGMRVKIEHQGFMSQGGLRHPVYRGKA